MSGRAARNLSDTELNRRLHRSDDEARAAGMELAELVRLAEEYELPMPFEPTTVVDGIIVHPSSGQVS